MVFPETNYMLLKTGMITATRGFVKMMITASENKAEYLAQDLEN